MGKPELKVEAPTEEDALEQLGAVHDPHFEEVMKEIARARAEDQPE